MSPSFQISAASLATLLPELALIWPLTERAWTKQSLAALKKLVRRARHVRSAGPVLTISLELSRDRLLLAATTVCSGRVASVTSTPYRFTDYYVGLPATPANQKGKSKSKGLNAAALKLRPGIDLDISMEGHPTRAVLNSIRRIELRGSKNWIKADLSIDVTKLPLLLERESKCDCRYCGSHPKGDEINCRNCGAPLPDC